MSYFQLKNKEELYYEDIGSGKDTIVFMSGWSVDHTVFIKPANLLKDRARCIYYDHRGHLKSKNANKEEVTMETLASDLNELITGLKLENITLLGWSMGVGVALTYIKMYGCKKLKKLILCDMTPKSLNDDEWHLGLRHGTFTEKDIEEENKLPFFQKYKSFVIEAVPRLKKVPAFLLDPALKKRLKNSDQKVLESLSKSMKYQDNRDALEKITVPLTYFYPYPEACFMCELKDYYKENVNVPYKAVKFDKTDHMFPSEKPNKFAEEIRKVLDENNE